MKESGAAHTPIKSHVDKGSMTLNIHRFSRRPVVVLSAALRALLPSKGSVLSGSKLPGADQSRRSPAARASLPQRRNQGAPAGSAPLHHPGPVSITNRHSCLYHLFTYHMSGGRKKKKHHMTPVVIIRSPVDGRLFLAYPHDSGALSQSFDKLQLLDDGGSDLVSVI